VSLFSCAFAWISIQDPALQSWVLSAKLTDKTLIQWQLDTFLVHHLYLCIVCIWPKAMLLVADHSFLVTQRWDIRVGTSQEPRTLITLKCLDTSVLNMDKNHLITLTVWIKTYGKEPDFVMAAVVICFQLLQMWWVQVLTMRMEWQIVVSLDFWCSSEWFTSHSWLVGSVLLLCAVVVQFTC
jgi:hypothetical protein